MVTVKQLIAQTKREMTKTEYRELIKMCKKTKTKKIKNLIK